MRRLKLVLVVVALLGGSSLAACTAVQNPATGETQYTSLTPQEEEKLGREEHPKVLAEFGGAYAGRRVTAYVSRIGERLKDVSELSGESFTFTVIDSPIVNAFALPGGYVYVTRGLLALADNEAEVAGVIGHEIGHVTARHTAQRYDRAMQAQLGQLGAVLLGAWLGGDVGARLGAQLGGLGGTAYVQGFSREQEFEADELGVRYLARAGYDPHAMVSFLEALNANDRLEASKSGGKRSETPSWLASHPRTPDRIERAASATEAGEPGAQNRLGRDEYLASIDGMVYGDSPAQGFVRDGTFIHPELGFKFAAPAGFKLVNTPAAVLGQGGSGRAMIFDMAKAQGSGDPATYIQREWVGEKQQVQDLHSLTVDGRPAALGFARVRFNNSSAVAMLGAVKGDGNAIYRFLFVSQDMRSDRPAYERSLQSLARLTPAEAQQYRPLRIKIVTVQPGDTIDTFVRQMAVEELPRETFEVLNDLGDGRRRLEAGEKVKLVVKG
jgi:predicted Zn-dependent protease